MNTSFTKPTADFNQYRYAAIRDFLNEKCPFNEFAAMKIVRQGDCFLKSFYLGNYHGDFEGFLSSTCEQLRIDMDSYLNSSEILWPHWVVFVAWMLSRINPDKIAEEIDFEKLLELYCDPSFFVSRQSMLQKGTPEHMVLLMDIMKHEAEQGLYKSPERAAYLSIHGVDELVHSVETSEFLWPIYTAKASIEDKEIFEACLRKLCHSTKKSMTKDIKVFLKAMVGDGVITRPEQINTEYEWVKRFGYPRAEKTYYNG